MLRRPVFKELAWLALLFRLRTHTARVTVPGFAMGARKREGSPLTTNRAGPTGACCLSVCSFKQRRRLLLPLYCHTVKIDQLSQLDLNFVQYVDIKVSAVIEKYLFNDIDIILKNTRKVYILKQAE